ARRLPAATTCGANSTEIRARSGRGFRLCPPHRRPPQNIIAGRSDVWGAPQLRLDDVSVPGRATSCRNETLVPIRPFGTLRIRSARFLRGNPLAVAPTGPAGSAGRHLGVGGPAERGRLRAAVARQHLLG